MNSTIQPQRISDTGYNLREIWKSARIPVVFRQGKGHPLLVRLPYAPDNYPWLRGEHLRCPDWNKQYMCWAVPLAWFESLVRRLVARFRSLYVIEPFRERQICAPACWNAVGVHCECSCLGDHHGEGAPGGRWYIVSEACAVQWGPRQYSCRLLVSPSIASVTCVVEV